jgi:hypothetical protein
MKPKTEELLLARRESLASAAEQIRSFNGGSP